MKEHIKCRKCGLGLTEKDSIPDGRCLACRMAAPKAAAPLSPELEKLLFQSFKDAPTMPKAGTTWKMPSIDSTIQERQARFDWDEARRTGLIGADEQMGTATPSSVPLATSKRWRTRIFINLKAPYIGAFWARRKTGLNVWINVIPCITIQLVIP